MRSHECTVEWLGREVQRRIQHALRPRLLASGRCTRGCEKSLCQDIRRVALGDLLAKVLGRCIGSCTRTCLSHAKNTPSKTLWAHVGQVVPSNCSPCGSCSQVLSIGIGGRSGCRGCRLRGVILCLAVQTNDWKLQSRSLLPYGYISSLTIICVCKLGVIDQAVGLGWSTSPLTTVVVRDREVLGSRSRRNRNSRGWSHNCLPCGRIDICHALGASCNTLLLASNSFQRHLQKTKCKQHRPEARSYGNSLGLPRALPDMHHELFFVVDG